MSRAFIVASTSAGLVAPGRAPRTRHSGPNPVALKPIGRSPAYAPSLKRKEDDVGGSRNKPGIARLFGGGNSDMKAKVAQLEYELENERAHASELGGKLRAVEGELAKVKDSLDLYKNDARSRRRRYSSWRRRTRRRSGVSTRAWQSRRSRLSTWRSCSRRRRGRTSDGRITS